MIRFLLDTNVLLWALSSPGRLSKRAKAVLESAENEIFFSAASVWEIAIKCGLGRVELAIDPDALPGAALDSGFSELPIFSAAAARVTSLPMHHRDPFDRLLVAQAMTLPAHLLTSDRVLAGYSDLVTLAE